MAGSLKVLLNDDVFTKRRLVFDGIVRGADIRLYLEGVVLLREIKQRET